MFRQTIETIGFIGLGVMGSAMCKNLVRAHQRRVIVFDIDHARVDELVQSGTEGAASADMVVNQSDLLITCLPGGDQVRDLFLGPEPLITRLQEGQIIIDMSTSPPALMQELAKAAVERGAHFADAPIARTRKAAIDGTLAIMVGADKALFDRIEPILAVMGENIMHCGATGAGQVAKIMNNMVLFQTIQALSEAAVLGERAGVDVKTLFEVIAKSSGDSFALRNHGMKSILPEDYPQNAFSVAYAAKDLSYALDMARQQGVTVSGAENVAERFEDAIKAGFGDQYFPVIRRLLTM